MDSGDVVATPGRPATGSMWAPVVVTMRSALVWSRSSMVTAVVVAASALVRLMTSATRTMTGAAVEAERWMPSRPLAPASVPSVVGRSGSPSARVATGSTTGASWLSATAPVIATPSAKARATTSPTKAAATISAAE